LRRGWIEEISGRGKARDRIGVLSGFPKKQVPEAATGSVAVGVAILMSHNRKIKNFYLYARIHSIGLQCALLPESAPLWGPSRVALQYLKLLALSFHQNKKGYISSVFGFSKFQKLDLRKQGFMDLVLEINLRYRRFCDATRY